MTTIVKLVEKADESKDIFYEGNLVESTQTGNVYLITVPAMGYEDLNSKDSFWGIALDGSFVSGGGYLKSLFKQFVGTITLQGKL